MNKSKLKTYAPEARRDYIQAVTQRANLLGLSATEIAPVQITGDIAMINGRPWPASVVQQRDLLIKRVQVQGFAAVMEAEAYGWFNRFAALRYMELHGYLDHGYRVLSNSNNADGVQGGLPEILENAASLDSASLPGLNRDEVIRLKLDGNKDNELYRLLLTTQCNALAESMGFLFETLGDETELLLPDNLLNTDSVIAKMVNNIDEADWEQVEIIGWLYQFYISDKKDEVIGKVVKSEDIPAATQLFTPNWIVKYLTQNSIGRLWLMANPSSNLVSQMEYYIKPAEQTPEVNAQLDALIQTRMAEDGSSLNPETITVLDPACGSGHILVEAYDLLKAIYLERGYQPRAIPRLILEKNLFGLDIDDRAAQLAGFALLMKARADDRRLFENKLVLNVMALQDSHGLDDETMAQTVFDAAIALEGGEALPSGQLFGGGQLETQHSSGLKVNDLLELIQFFEHAKTFGSLLTVPNSLTAKLDKLEVLLRDVAERGNSLAQSYANQIREHFLIQGLILSRAYDAVIANPPYMGGKGMNPLVKDFAKKRFPDSKSDLFAMFIERGFGWCKASGFNSMVTMQSWMFLSSYEAMRENLLGERTIITMAHLGARAFTEISGEVVQTTAFVLQRQHQLGFKPVFFRLIEGNEREKAIALTSGSHRHDQTVQDDFKKIPSSPLSYWVDRRIVNCFRFEKVSSFAEGEGKNVTADNDRFLRNWWEVSVDRVGRNRKWLQYAKGGPYRKWWGNLDFVIDWSEEAKEFYARNTSSRIIDQRFWYRPGITWTDITSSGTGFRYLPSDSTYDTTGISFFLKDDSGIVAMLSALNSKPYSRFLSIINPTIHANLIDIKALPVPNLDAIDEHIGKRCIEISELDWNFFEIAEKFRSHSLCELKDGNKKLSASYLDLRERWEQLIREIQCLEIENNQVFIGSFGLKEVLSPDVAQSDITLTCNPSYRYRGIENEIEREAALLVSTLQELISYAIGCMMGRYSLDEPGLIYAHAGNVGFDLARYTKFPADADGIVPVTDEYWFDDDATNRVREFLIAVWGEATLNENMNWLADSLGRKAGQNAEDAIRAYIAGSFFKDHLKTYKKRPIYWLFSSGKHKAFECLVYLHRYNEGTLARMRNEYVIPLAGKFGGRADLLQNQINNASTTSERNKLQKELDLLKKKQLELAQFDEQLRHYADQRISLDLDDGVKVNYGKFGNLLAEVKAITGGAGDD
ncbi:BREX-1 system adenine-specific DNA-methyltransferase PglX [Undibacterium sp. Di24W]|uniref:BREX-1 system adenine-specific DNA-methyltransferase PglX n=1 Tax=Undibacterium sp. Di24W TaxID=3413033 RepID=UPI003BF04AE1